MSNLKKCTRCGKIKSFEEFPLRKEKTRKSDSRRSHCKKCKNKENSNWLKSDRHCESLGVTIDYQRNPGARATAILAGVRKRGKAKGIEATITKEFLEKRIVNGCCEVTGIPFVFENEDTNGAAWLSFWSPSIDRIDPTGGYTEENCRVVVVAFNIAKSSMPDEDVLKLAEAIVNNKHLLNLD